MSPLVLTLGMLLSLSTAEEAQLSRACSEDERSEILVVEDENGDTITWAVCSQKER